MRSSGRGLNTEPFREYVFCHYCNQWGTEDQFSVATMIVGGVVRQVLHHTVQLFWEVPAVTHMANWRRDLDGLEHR